MSSFSDALVRLRKQDKLTQVEAARKMGITRSALSMYETGQREPDFETLELIADFYNVDMNTLYGRVESTVSPLPDNILPMPGMGRVALLGQIACGEPITAEENIEDYVDLPDHIRADFALRCRGDSMINARIFDGDIVYIRQQADVSNGEIAAVLIGTEATLKRVYHYGGRLELRPENPTFPVLSFGGDELAEIRILGKAVAFTSAVR